MLLKHRLAPAAALLAGVLAASCGGTTTAPSSTSSAAQVQTSPPAPPRDFSQMVGTWNLALRVTTVTPEGEQGCLADTLRSWRDSSRPYTLAVTSDGRVTLTDVATKYWSAFSPDTPDSANFTTYGQRGWGTYNATYLVVRCSDGTDHRLFTFGEDIAGRVSGTEISGTWDAAFFDQNDPIYFYKGIEIKAEFTGRR